MTTIIAISPSKLASIKVETINNIPLFKFNDELQARMEQLLAQK